MLIKYLYIVLVVFFILSPFIFILYRSFTYRTYWGIEFVGLKFYSEIPPAYWRALVNSLIVGLLVSLIDFTIAFPAAFILARYEFKYKRILTALLVAPMFTPDVVAGVGLATIYIRYYKLYGSFVGTLLGLASTSYPMMLLPLFASLRTLDPIYEDVARTLGAKPYQVVTRVVLPLIGPGIFSGFVLTFVWCLNNYLLPLFITGGAIDLLAVKLYSDIRWWGLLGRVAAEASILQIFTFIVVLLYLKSIGERYKGGFAL
jgi:ABC-type spermidine/putrescine transport system permease subunit II